MSLVDLVTYNVDTYKCTYRPSIIGVHLAMLLVRRMSVYPEQTSVFHHCYYMYV